MFVVRSRSSESSPSALLFVPHRTFAETPEDYHIGGLHPVHLNDILHNRYKIKRKLGGGASATTPPVRRPQDLQGRYFSKADPGARHARSDRYHGSNRSGSPTSPSSTKRLRDPRAEWIALMPCPSANGPSLGSLEHLVREERSARIPAPLLPILLSKEISRQILLGLDCLQRHGIVDSDLHPGNVLFVPSTRLAEPDQAKPRFHTRLFESWSGTTSGTTPDYFPFAEPLAEPCRLDSRVKIQLSDMGSAFLLSDGPKYPRTCDRTTCDGKVLELDLPLEDRLRKEGPDDMTDTDADADELLDVLRKIFVYDINERPTASELLQEKWFNAR
ncbi:MAG: hypothetical protein M1816_003217 [Peltula sp. TS41687]|nr:MAG: hypothetical protein M1816_003217 [Peltula sp. TS41687]